MPTHRFFCGRLPAPAAPAIPPAGITPTGIAQPVPSSLSADHVQFDEDDAHHARRVLRLSVGDRVELLDGRGRVAQATVIALKPDVLAGVEMVHEFQPLQPRLIVAGPLPKGDRADAMINSLAQLGVDQFIPLATERGVVKPRGTKIGRLSKVSREAAKQSGCPWLMDITPVASLPDVMAMPADDRRIATGPGPAERELATVTSHIVAHSNSATSESTHTDSPPATHDSTVLVLIGPEGGWTPAEHDAARQAGFAAWRLGPHIMRIETAACAAAAIIRAGTR